MLPLRQVAYFVPDIRAAALAHSRSLGSGPFFVLNHVELTSSEHRGVSRPLDHSSAYGQWGTVMIEFAMQHNDDPSAFHDLYPRGSGRFGMHHTALWVDDLGAAIARFASEGMALSQYAVTATGTDFAFVDGVERYGHMIELYEPSPGLTGFYDVVAQAAEGWATDPKRREPIRELN